MSNTVERASGSIYRRFKSIEQHGVGRIDLSIDKAPGLLSGGIALCFAILIVSKDRIALAHTPSAFSLGAAVYREAMWVQGEDESRSIEITIIKGSEFDADVRNPTVEEQEMLLISLI